MTFTFRNRIIFWDIPKWNKGQINWDGEITLIVQAKVVCIIERNGPFILVKCVIVKDQFLSYIYNFYYNHVKMIDYD